MGEKSQIQWTDHTWNIAVGCTKVDADCLYCYMYRQSLNSTRFDPHTVKRTKTVFKLPLKIKEASKIFTCSYTDFFHEEIDNYRNEAWDIIRKCPQHTFQILTKRPDRIKDHLPADWGKGWKNVWLGTSVGSDAGVQRALDLIKLRDIAHILFLSLEPLHGEINFRWKYAPEVWLRRTELFRGEQHKVLSQHELLLNIDWVIVGGESGNENGKYKYRPCELKWIEHIVTHCQEANVPVFVKQLGTYLSKELKLKDRHAGDISEFPEHLRIRQFPA